MFHKPTPEQFEQFLKEFYSSPNPNKIRLGQAFVNKYWVSGDNTSYPDLFYSNNEKALAILNRFMNEGVEPEPYRGCFVIDPINVRR